MIGAMARHRVQVLRGAGKTLKQIVAETGVSQRSVQGIELERPLETVADLSPPGGWCCMIPTSPRRSSIACSSAGDWSNYAARRIVPGTSSVPNQPGASPA